MNEKQVTAGTIKANLSDAKLQVLAMETLLAHSTFDERLQTALKPSFIQGIMNAERSLWGINDDFPSIPDAWARALFSVSLPVKGIAEMDDAGWVAAGGIAGGIAVAILFTNPVGWSILAGAGLGIVLVEGAYSIGAAVVGDLNSTVGRGQIGQDTWDRAVAAYGEYFPQYLDKVFENIDLKGQMERKIETYKLNDISVEYNPMDKKNVKVLENFMIAPVLLGKIRADRYEQGRSLGDTIKYALLAYKGASNYSIAEMNRKLQLPVNENGVTLAFPTEPMIDDPSLTSEARKNLRYVYEAYNYAQSH